MKNYLFYDEATGEEFIVQEADKATAVKTAEEYFDEPRYIAKLTEFESEMSGLDVY